MSDTKKVSLYIPCFNSEQVIEQCITAILSQTRVPDEIIVVDDGSADRTAEIASRYRVKVASHAVNLGIGAARNTGIRSSSGDLVASIDADCVARPDWLETLMRCLEDELVAGAGGRLIETKCESLPDRWRTSHMRQDWGEEFVANPPFLFGNNTLFRKAALEKAGQYNEKLRTNFEDVTMGRKLTQLGFNTSYEPRAVVEHLRTDTIASILRTNWKWRFLGYSTDITFLNVIRHMWGLSKELRYHLGIDWKLKDPAGAIFSCVAVAYTVIAEIAYCCRHYGDKGLYEV
jgi:glycosyltransferase involved in cell wall biosynthesis